MTFFKLTTFKKKNFFFFLFFICSAFSSLSSQVKSGLDNLFTKKYTLLLKNQKIGLVTNQTAISSTHVHAIDLFKRQSQNFNFKLIALFAPEHGLNGSSYASEKIEHLKDSDNIPIFSLHGNTKRPTKKMLEGITLIIFDIQDIGSRSYTYASTLFYMMEEAAKLDIKVVVLDRPNPINGMTIDGPMLKEEWRSFVGYINVPYCHGMTIGELALYFNQEYQIGCNLEIIPMEGWKRSMQFKDTGLFWIPTSPNIPEADTPYFYPTTGLIGELQIVNIGIGYTLPFKIIGAPWIKAEVFAKELNAQKFPGVWFYPFYYRPFFGRFAKENCEGILISITDPLKYLPVSTQFLIMGLLKSLYPSFFQKALEESKKSEDIFKKVTGTSEIYQLLQEEKYVVWKLLEIDNAERKNFQKKRQPYLISSYPDR